MKTDQLLNILNKEGITVKNLLPLLKANRYTYNGLNDYDTRYFRKYYKELKAIENESISIMSKFSINNLLLDDNYYSEFVSKEKVMYILLTNRVLKK